jgi:hypothetical protein
MMHSLPSLPNVVLILGFSLLTLSPEARAFEVIKNINSGKPPVEKLVIFEKGKPTDHLSFVDDANCKMSFAEDGSIVCRIINNAVIKPMIRWKGGGLPEHFPLKEYDYLILTCRMEGTNKVTNNGKTSDQRGDNLWFPVALFDDAGTLLGSASLADPTPDRRTPDKTTTLQFPKTLLTFWGPGKGNVSAVGFSWGKTHDNITRDYTLVIDKIAFANDAP